MKKRFLSIGTLCAGVTIVASMMFSVTPAFAQLTEGFETGLPTTAPTIATDYTLSSGVWTLYRGVRNTTKHSGSYAVSLSSSASNPSYIITPALNTVGSITLWTRGSGASTLTISKSVNGGAYTTIVAQKITSAYASYTITVNETGSNVRIRFQNGTSASEYIDDVVITTSSVTPTPTLSVNPTSLTFGNVVVNTTGQKTYALSGANLSPSSGNITITAPSGYQVSTASGSGFASSITVAYSGSALASTTIYANFTPTAVQAYSGSISNAGGGATTQNVAVSGNGVSTPTPSLTVSPTSLAYGNVTINTAGQKTYTLSGSNLTPTSGNITITAPSGYQVSTASSSGFASSITVAYSGSALTSTTIYVNFTPTIVQAYNGSVTNVGGGATTQNVAVSGTGVSSGGVVTTYYVSTTGDDSNNGTSLSTPFKTIIKAVGLAKAGDIIYVRAGTYTSTTTIAIASSGTSDNMISLHAYPGDARPLLDFSSMPTSDSNYGIRLSGQFWYIKGLKLKGAGDNGLLVQGGSNNLIEYCDFFECDDTGLQLKGGAANNKIINCDSYYNADPGQGNADGFAPKMDVGSGNYFYGCRAWQNSDDGYDGYLRGADNVTTTYENCWCIKNGYLKSGSASSGNGNGFKTGGSDGKDLKHNCILKNCISVGNRSKGYDHNSNRGDVTLYNCFATSNGTNMGFSSTNPLNKLTIKNTSVVGTTGNVYASSTDITNNSWQNGLVADANDYESLDANQLTAERKADGSLPDLTFAKLVVGSDLIDKGVNVGLPYNGSAPDVNCTEYAGESSVIALKGASVAPIVVPVAAIDDVNIEIFPNPFTISARLVLNLRNDSKVQVMLFNMEGKQVKSILHGSYSAGTQTVEINKEALAPGIYFCKVVVNGKPSIHKLIVQ